ncbi:MAG TPA: hypothetical protein VF339_20090 [Gammaproteobacteria bacterium]
MGVLRLVAPANAQGQGRPICRFSIDGGWSNDAPAEYITRRARRNDVSGVPQVVERIKGELGIQVDFDIYIAEEEDNAMAAVANGRRILIVDVGFLERLNVIAGTGWGAIQVIAHEVGHHIAGFSAASHRNELNADYWSGQTLQRLGAARTAATRAIMAFGTEVDTPSHPNKYRRAATIERGWDDASRGVIDYAFCMDCR